MTGKGATCNGLIVFSDLDGTLLDHRNYSHNAAAPALEALRRGGHCLVLASSKTAAELTGLRAELGFAHCPAITENGAGLLPGDDGTLRARPAAGRVTDRDRILTAIAELPGDLRRDFSGFSDWSAAEIARRTGLAPRDAEKAAMREFSEPGIWCGSVADFDRFAAELAAKGICIQQGGRFTTLSFGATKADRMDEILRHYRAAEPALIAMALGDAPNDVAMLERADRGFVVRNDAHCGVPKLAGERSGRIRRTEQEGPAGWNAAVLSILQEMNRTR